MADQLILKESMFHDDSVKSIHVWEDFLSDGRSYVSEHWAWEGTTNVTYFFAADGKIPTEGVRMQILLS